MSEFSRNHLKHAFAFAVGMVVTAAGTFIVADGLALTGIPPVLAAGLGAGAGGILGAIAGVTALGEPLVTKGPSIH